MSETPHISSEQSISCLDRLDCIRDACATCDYATIEAHIGRPVTEFEKLILQTNHHHTFEPDYDWAIGDGIPAQPWKLTYKERAIRTDEQRELIRIKFAKVLPEHVAA